MASNQAEQELVNAMASFSKDPYGWVLFSFEWGVGELKGHDGPDEWQAEVLKSVRDGLLTLGEAIQIAIASGHGIGKSALVSWLILWSLSTFEDTMGVVTANTETQLKTKTWAQLAKWYRLCICRHWFKFTATAIFSVDPEHERTWRIDMIAWSERNTEAFAGLHNQGKRIVVVFDEASAIPDVIWEVSEGALTDMDTEIMWFAFGNPTRNTGRFKDCFGRFRHRWQTKQIDSRTSRITNKEKIQEWIDDYGIDSDFVKVRVRGMFPSMSMKQFISVDDVDKAFGKHLRPEQYNFAPKILTCDPAWEGDDMLEIGIRQGLADRNLRSIAKNDNDIEIANILARIEDEEEADAVFIDAGYGTGIVSAGRTMGRNWQLVWFGGESPDRGCLNMRAYIWNEMKKWLKAGGAIEPDTVLYHDLIGPETVPRADGKIQLESKKDMKGRGLPSPGKADRLALSFAFPVAKKQRGVFAGQKSKEEYNPLGRA